MPDWARGWRMTVGSALIALACAGQTQAANWFEKNFWLHGPRYDAMLPACDNTHALGLIQNRFATKEGRFWNSSLRILGFEQVYETAFRPWAENTIPRRFCKGYALVSDGVRRPVYYWIGEDTGLAGQWWGVEWCVVGLDRNWAFNPGCRMAQP